MPNLRVVRVEAEWLSGAGHTAQRVSPLLRCGRPISQSSFFSLPNIMHHPLLRSSLCPPGPVSRTSAMAGADGRGACGRTTCSLGSPLPPSHPAAAGPSLQRLTQPATFLPPCMGAAGSVRGTFPPNLLQCSQPVLMLCQASHLATRLLFLRAPISALPAPPHPHSPYGNGVRGQ